MKLMLLSFVAPLLLGRVAVCQDSMPKPASRDAGQPAPIRSLPKSAQQKLAWLHVGMTRKEVESLFPQDGGLCYPLTPRYYLPDIVVDSQVIMLELSFQPENMPDAIYNDEKLRILWVLKHQDYSGNDAHDILRAIGAPYLSGRHID